MKAKQYQPTKLKPIIQLAARLIKGDPTLLDDIDAPQKENQLKRLRDLLKYQIPELADKKRCPNCSASMAEYVETLDINDALLLLNMAKLVRESEFKGWNFTDANKIRVSSADIPHTQKCRTSKCAKLGLIAKAGASRWSITRRGWDALCGKEVPKVRVTFRGRILERPEETTTFADVFREHGDKMRDLERRSRKIKNDQRAAYADYKVSDWVEIAGFQQGTIL